jgi:hypothetical protein
MPIDVLFEKSRSNFVVKLRDLIIDETSDLCLIPVNASKGLDIAKSIQNSSQNIENYFIQYGTINRGLNDRVTVVSGSFSQKETNLALELGMGIVNVYNFDVL